MTHINEDLVNERRKCSFNIQELIYVIDRGEENTNKRKLIGKSHFYQLDAVLRIQQTQVQSVKKAFFTARPPIKPGDTVDTTMAIQQHTMHSKKRSVKTLRVGQYTQC